MKLISALKLIDPKLENLHVITEEEKTDLQKLLFEMMNDISCICAENKINWSLSGGSVLGAVRHKGFIPWDDDMDINMTRNDFDKFCKVFPGRMSDKYLLILPGDPDYLFHTPIIMRKNTTFRGLISTDDGCHGVFIDIFIMENVSDNPLKYYLQGFLCIALYGMQSMVRTYYCKDTLLKYTSHYPEIQRSIKFRAFWGRLLSVKPISFWSKKVIEVFSLEKNNDTKRVSIPSGRNHYFGETYDRDKVCKFQKCQFSNVEFPIPIDYDYYLKKLYGITYMTPPTEKDRMQHVVIEFNLNNEI